MKKIVIKNIFFNILCFIFAILLIKGGINDVINPFFTAFLFGFASLRINPFKYLFGASFAYLLLNFTIVGFSEIAVVVAFIIVLSVLPKRFKFYNILTIVFLLLSSVVQFVFVARSSYSLVLCCVNLLLKVVTYYFYRSLFFAFFTRGIQTKFTVDEFIGGVLLIIPLSITTFGVSVFSVNVGLSLAAFFIMLTSLTVGALEAITLAVVIGLGVSVCRGDILMLAALPLWATGVSAVKRTGRGIMVLVLFIIDIVLGLYFNVYSVYNQFNLLALGVAGFFLIIIPKQKLNKLKLFFTEEGKELSCAWLTSMEENYFLTRIKKMSNLFYEIHRVYDNLIMGSLNKKDITKSIKSNIINKNCMQCVKRNVCYNNVKSAEKAISDFVSLAVDKNRARVVDVPVFLASNCGKANQMMFAINAYLEEFNKLNNKIKREDEGKLLVSNQLLGVSDILNNFITVNSFGTRATKESEQRLIDELLYNNILIKECAIFEQDKMFTRVVIVIKNNKYKKEHILKVLNKYFKQNLEIIENRYAKKAGYNIVSFGLKPRYSYYSGTAKLVKNGISGDGFSLVMLENNRFMVSLSDGKGVGPKANRLSEMSLSLIEKFYRAGYTSQVIMENVNKVLSFKGGENFSAVDVTVVNLEDGSIDFVKRGGTPTVVKRASGEAFSVVSSSLPIGLVENAKTEVVSNHLFSGDVVVLSSDGVFDAFNSVENYTGFINNINELDMNRFCKTLLNEAVRLNAGEIKDDMTIVAYRII